MNRITVLGDYVCLVFFKDWLSFVEIAKLETSFSKFDKLMVYDRIAQHIVDCGLSLKFYTLDSFWNWAFERGIKIKEVFLSKSKGITSLINYCDKYCDSIHKLHISNLEEELNLIVLDLIPRLKHLNEFLFTFRIEQGENIQHFIGAVVDHCPSITSLDLNSQWQLLDLHVHTLAASYPKLQSINLSRCLMIRDPAITELAEKCGQHLTALNISSNPHITDTALASISKHCVCLTQLDCNSCSALTLHGMETLIRTPTLQECLINLDFSYNYRTVTDASLIELSTHYTQLTRLHIAGSGNATDIGVIAICKSCRRLTDLNISDTEQLTFTAYYYILLYLVNLKALTFWNSQYQQEEGCEHVHVMMLAECFTFIQSVNFYELILIGHPATRESRVSYLTERFGLKITECGDLVVVAAAEQALAYLILQLLYLP